MRTQNPIENSFIPYSFQGQEHDNEVKGEGNSMNYKYRMCDPRVGRFFAVDPLASKYPWNSVYAFSANRVIDSKEVEGLESEWVLWAFGGYATNKGTGKLIIVSDYDVYTNSYEQVMNSNYDMVYIPPLGECQEIDEEGFVVIPYALNMNDWNMAVKSYLEMFKMDNLNFLAVNTHSGPTGMTIQYIDSDGQNQQDRLNSYKVGNCLKKGSCDGNMDEKIKLFLETINFVGEGGEFVVLGCLVGQDMDLGVEILNNLQKGITVYTNQDYTTIDTWSILNKALTSTCNFGRGWTVTTCAEGASVVESSVKIGQDGMEFCPPVEYECSENEH